MSTVKVSSVNLNSSENTKISIATNNLDMLFTANNAERMRIDANGNIGVGTTNPNSLLDVAGGTLASSGFGAVGVIGIRRYEGTTSSPTSVISTQNLGRINFLGYDGTSTQIAAQIQATSDGAITPTDSAGSLRFYTTPTGSTTTVERMRITSNGNVLIGTTSTYTPLGASKVDDPNLSIAAAGKSAALGISTWSSETFGPDIQFMRSLGTSVGTHTTVTNGTSLGTIRFSGTDTSVAGIFRQSTLISSTVEGTAGNGFVPGRLEFYTTSQADQAISERVRITSNGDVGIGTTAPQGVLHISTGISSNAVFISQTGSGNAIYIEDSANDPTPFVIDNGGRIIQGNPTALALGDTGQIYKLQLHGTSGTFAVQSMGTVSWQTGSASSGLFMGKSRGGAIGTYAVLNNNDQIGQIRWGSSNGTQFIVSSVLGAYSDGPTSATSTPTRLTFTTTPGNSIVDVERMRITSNGEVAIGTTSTFWQGFPSTLSVATTPDSDYLLFLIGYGAVASSVDQVFYKTRGSTPTTRSAILSNDALGGIWFSGANTATTDGTGAGIQAKAEANWSGTSLPTRLAFHTSATGAIATTERMRITNTGEVWIATTADQGIFNLQVGGTGIWGAGAYTNGSDERIKEDIQPISSSLNIVQNLNPVTFKYKETWSKDQSIQPGFVAQELLIALANTNYVNGIVTQGPEYYSVAYQSLIPILTKAIQELKSQNDELKARVEVLENK